MQAFAQIRAHYRVRKIYLAKISGMGFVGALGVVSTLMIHPDDRYRTVMSPIEVMRCSPSHQWVLTLRPAPAKANGYGLRSQQSREYLTPRQVNAGTPKHPNLAGDPNISDGGHLFCFPGGLRWLYLAQHASIKAMSLANVIYTRATWLWCSALRSAPLVPSAENSWMAPAPVAYNPSKAYH
ncbi:uncharacterized protein LAJ45_10132 [Morchella importuna]|uniref:uncharacterized protein n=1 Tax=Morchella importuna TaxID=1174673 RepID=UPI001E8C9EF6|nr:uncharacterized protein LAJ45_10132 [Morchella importuna]KAH8145809.1 hypothetical protein LAJ45_10132 [Morchella importuna]